MRTLKFTIPSEYDGRKVLHFLKGCAGLSSRLIRSLKMYENGIEKNGVHTRTVDILHTGDVLVVNIPEDTAENKDADRLIEDSRGDGGTEQGRFELSEHGVEILYEDEDLLIVNKPGTLAIHQSHNHQGDTLADLIYAYLKQKNKRCVFRAIGRLDKGTSGIVVCALNAYAANRLQGKIHKTYYAVATGCYSGSGTVNFPIYRPDPIKTLRVVDERGAPAVTHWEALKTGADKSLLRVTLETGRTHQIRVHFAHLGTPLVGDTMYGTPSDEIKRQALHCALARLFQPFTGEVIEVCAPLPEDIKNIVDGI